MAVEYMQLRGAERLRYFAPTMICAYVSTLCLGLLATAPFVASRADAVAVSAAGVFGLLLSGGLGLVFWRAQRHDLEYVRLTTAHAAAANAAAVHAAVHTAGWRILAEDPEQRIEIQTGDDAFSIGERLVVEFRGSDVLIAGICDPGVGFSLVGRRRCAEHRARLEGSVLDDTPAALATG